MNKVLYLTIVCLFLVSCSSNKDSLSSGTIEDLVEEQLEERNMLNLYATIDTGYYECNFEPTRRALRKLSACGLVTYKATRYAWYNKYTHSKRVFSHSRPRYLYGYYLGSEDVYTTQTTTDYELEEHFLVHVTLTEKAKEFQVDSIPEYKNLEELEDKDLKPLQVKLSEYPEYKVKDEKWKEIPYPVSRPKNAGKKKDRKNENTEEEDASASIGKNAVDPTMATKYKAELKKLNSRQAYFEAVTIGIKKARKIKLSTGTGATTATAEVIGKIKDSNDFGRIILNLYEDSKFSFAVDLIYFEDMGWQIDGEIKFRKATNPVVEYVDEKGNKISEYSSEEKHKDEIDESAVDSTAVVDYEY